MGKTLGELAQMPVAEYRSWQAYADIEPFGHHYDDLRSGALVAANYNVNRDVKKRAEPYQALDFVPWNDMAQQQAEPLQLPDAQAEANALMRAFGVQPPPPDGETAP